MDDISAYVPTYFSTIGPDSGNDSGMMAKEAAALVRMTTHNAYLLAHNPFCWLVVITVIMMVLVGAVWSAKDDHAVLPKILLYTGIILTILVFDWLILQAVIPAVGATIFSIPAVGATTFSITIDQLVALFACLGIISSFAFLFTNSDSIFCAVFLGITGVSIIALFATVLYVIFH